MCDRDREAVGVLGVLFVLIAAIGLIHLATGCATVVDKINAVNEAARGARAVAGPLINEACLAKARACAAEGIASPAACKPLTACRAVRDAFYKAVEAIHVAAAGVKVAVAVGRADGLDQTLAAAKQALDRAWEMAIKAGYVTAAAP